MTVIRLIQKQSERKKPKTQGPVYLVDKPMKAISSAE
jgi:hypothetical protein